MRFLSWGLLFCLACGGATAQHHTESEDIEQSAMDAKPQKEEEPAPEIPAKEEPQEKTASAIWDPISLKGQSAVGAYITGPYVKRYGAKGIIKTVKSARLNAVVIDMKDGQGRVGYDTKIPELDAQEKPFLGDVKALVKELHDADIYTIARITCFADPRLPETHPERSIKHFKRDEPWTSWGTGTTWLDPYNRENHKMIAELAKEAASFGYDEIQLDYVRFPVDGGTKYARYPAEDGTSRVDLLLELLKRVDESVSIPLGVDVFGLTAYREGDPSGLGQGLARWTKYVEVFCPMLYINAMRTWALKDKLRAQHLIENGVRALRGRIGKKSVIRPWLQSFEKGAGPTGYNARFIKLQVRGAAQGTSDGFLFWHPGSIYSMAKRGMKIYPGPIPFKIEEELVKEREASE